MIAVEPVRTLTDVDFEVERAEMTRVLGYPDGELPERTKHLIEEVSALGRTLLRPVCSYRLLAEEEAPAESYLSGRGSFYLCLVTIGGELEAEAERLKASGELARALVLDTYGSAAAESLAEAAEGIIRAESPFVLSNRFSPGYGNWSLEEQRWILSVLEAESLGVTLTEGCMMVPRKSITFAMVEADREEEVVSRCAICGMRNCRFRHQ